MPRIPNPTRTISQLLETQFPDFIREDYPNFVAFLKAYYEWLETNGQEVYQAKCVSADRLTITFPETASDKPNAYEGMNVVVLNGPAKGQSRKIIGYDPHTKTARIE